MNGTVNGIQLFAMNFSDLDRAMDLRKQKRNAEQGSNNQGQSNPIGDRKRCRDDDGSSMDVDVESSHLLLSHMNTRTSSFGKDQKNSRTGRWSSEEVAFADHLVSAFDQGYLPLPHGVKLNEFLGDMLLCKSSRLTKKMKNAKLSTRSFTLQNILRGTSNENYFSMSALQEHFLISVPSEAMQLELKFNITKMWRTHFSNLCIQVGYDLLDANDWLSSLEDMEKRAFDAEDVVRKARRRRMGLALRHDVGQTANTGVFFSGIPARDASVSPPALTTSCDAFPTSTTNSTYNQAILPRYHNEEAMKRETIESGNNTVRVDNDTVDFLENVLDDAPSRLTRSLSEEDLSICLQDFADPLTMVPSAEQKAASNNFACGPFVEKVIRYIEKHNLPFQYVDVWVPSYSVNEQSTATEGNNKANEELRLYHAGYMTRTDIDTELSANLNEFGAYSTHFSFMAGKGLPGRVYTSGEPAWDDNINNADPHIFERVGGARVYGLRTAVGIPLTTPVVGRIVLSLYSTSRVPQDEEQLKCYCSDFDRWTPEPKWKLVIDLGEGKSSQPESIELAKSTQGASSNSKTEEELEQRIASLLGHQMPVDNSQTDGCMVQHYMSLRLLLLRSQDRRTNQESEMLDVIKKSFHGYSQHNKRNDAELASLLVKDWVFLYASNQPASSMSLPEVRAPTQQAYKSHVMHPPPVETKCRSGVPTTMPSALLSLHLSSVANQSTSLDRPQHSFFSFPGVDSLGSGDPTKLVHRRHTFEDPRTKGEGSCDSVPGDHEESTPTVVPET